jgi:hypothetical protein
MYAVRLPEVAFPVEAAWSQAAAIDFTSRHQRDENIAVFFEFPSGM